VLKLVVTRPIVESGTARASRAFGFSAYLLDSRIPVVSNIHPKSSLWVADVEADTH
jgi:hypothetical protein